MDGTVEGFQTFSLVSDSSTHRVGSFYSFDVLVLKCQKSSSTSISREISCPSSSTKSAQ